MTEFISELRYKLKTSHLMFEFTQLFCTIDDFFQKNKAVYRQYLKQENPSTRHRPATLCLAEIVFIAGWYKKSQLHQFKAFYSMIKHFYRALFKVLPSYQRIQRHKSLKEVATRGKSSMGWFYGCKLHVLVNQQGNFIRTILSNGHTADLKMLPKLAQGYKGKIFGDRGYISGTLKESLAKLDIELITYHRNNMMPVQLSSHDEKLLRQRNKIETIFSLLKQQYNLVTSRHRSISGYFAGIYALLCAYQICHQNKPTFIAA